MTYKPDDFRGELQDGIRLSDCSGQELYNLIKDNVLYYTKEHEIPAIITDAEVKSGNFLSGTRLPLLIIHHPDSSCKYFDIGVLVNGNLVTFPLIGKSAENYKYNMHEHLKAQGKIVQAALYKPDIYKIQQEEDWERKILNCINTSFAPTE